MATLGKSRNGWATPPIRVTVSAKKPPCERRLRNPENYGDDLSHKSRLRLERSARSVLVVAVVTDRRGAPWTIRVCPRNRNCSCGTVKRHAISQRSCRHIHRDIV